MVKPYRDVLEALQSLQVSGRRGSLSLGRPSTPAVRTAKVLNSQGKIVQKKDRSMEQKKGNHGRSRSCKFVIKIACGFPFRVVGSFSRRGMFYSNIPTHLQDCLFWTDDYWGPNSWCPEGA